MGKGRGNSAIIFSPAHVLHMCSSLAKNMLISFEAETENM